MPCLAHGGARRTAVTPPPPPTVRPRRPHWLADRRERDCERDSNLQQSRTLPTPLSLIPRYSAFKPTRFGSAIPRPSRRPDTYLRHRRRPDRPTSSNDHLFHPSTLPPTCLHFHFHSPPHPPRRPAQQASLPRYEPRLLQGTALE